MTFNLENRERLCNEIVDKFSLYNFERQLQAQRTKYE
jgi:hypothetical protein